MKAGRLRPDRPPPAPPPPASKPQMNAAGTQTIFKPTPTPSSGSGDPYFSGIGGGYQPPPAPPAPPPQGAAAVNPANPAQDFEQKLQEECKATIVHIAEVRRIREDIHKKFIDSINVDFGGGKKPVASQMADAVMGTGGGGGPRGPPPGSAGFVRMEVENINNKRQPVEF